MTTSAESQPEGTVTIHLTDMAGIAAAAGRHFQTALRQAHELPHRIEQPEVRGWYARMLLDRDAPGDRERARHLLTEAVAMYRTLGMPKHVEIAEALLDEAGRYRRGTLL